MDPLANHPNPSPFQVPFPAKDRLGRLVSGSMTFYYNKVKYNYSIQVTFPAKDRLGRLVSGSMTIKRNTTTAMMALETVAENDSLSI